MTSFSYVRQLLGRVAGTDDEEPVTDGGVPADDGVRERLADRVGEDFLESAPFWLPPAALVGLFVYGAVVWNVVISLTDYEGFADPDYTDLDFEMYVQAFNSSQVVTAGVNTLVLLVGFTVVSLALGLVIAILVDRNIRFENTFRTIYLLPMSLSFVVTAQFWLWMYDYDGVLNNVFGLVGVGRSTSSATSRSCSRRWCSRSCGSSPATRWWCISPPCGRSRRNTSRRRGWTARPS